MSRREARLRLSLFPANVLRPRRLGLAVAEPTLVSSNGRGPALPFMSGLFRAFVPQLVKLLLFAIQLPD